MRKLLSALMIIASYLQAQPTCVTFSKIEYTTRFILVVDVSGSMNGKPLKDAKVGVSNFINQMDVNDAAALLTFSDEIKIAHSMTNNNSSLLNKVKQMSSGGSTHLFDALAKAIDISKGYKEKVAVVLLTDGRDSGSQFTAKNIESMVGYHGIAFYALGLGDVDQNTLKTLAQKTTGAYDHTPNSSELKNLYRKTMNVYKTKHIISSHQTAQLKVYSMPGGKSVTLDGKYVGKSPLKIINIQPGEHNIEVAFDGGNWQCKGRFQAGELGQIRAMESDVSKNIAVMSVPHGSAVFLDEEFQGYTSSFLVKSNTVTKGLIFKKQEKTMDYSRELIIENVPRGEHTISLVPFADSEVAGMFDKTNYSFQMGSKNLIINVDAITGKTEVQTTSMEIKPKANRFKLDQSTIFDDF